MILTSRTQCSTCSHYQSSQKCDAYPDKIPDQLWSGDVIHDEPFPGDHGLRRDPLRLPPYTLPYD